jgi:hypothetical protein
MATFDVTQAPMEGFGSTPDAMYSPGFGGVQYAQGSLDNLYLSLLNRSVYDDPAGLEHWTQAMQSGASAADIQNAIRQSDEYRNRPLAATPNTVGNAAALMPAGNTPQQFSSPVAVYPYPVGYNMQIGYDPSGNRVYNYTPDGSTYTNIPSYEGSQLGSPITNPNHPVLQGNQAGQGLQIDNVTAGMISNIISGATGLRPSMQDVYDVYGRVGSTATDWDGLVQQTLAAWSDPQLRQGEQSEPQQYYGRLADQLAQGQAQGSPLTIGQNQDFAKQYFSELNGTAGQAGNLTPAQIAAANRAAGITTQVNQFAVPDMMGLSLNAQQDQPMQQMQPRSQMNFPGMVAPYDLPGSLPGAPQSRYDPFAALQSMQRQPMEQQFSQPSVQNPIFGGNIPMDFGPGPGNAALDTSAQSQAAKDVMDNRGNAGNAAQTGPTGTGTISRPVAVQPGQTVTRADGSTITIGDTSIRSGYGGNSGVLVPVDGKFVDSRTGQDYSDFVSPLDREYLEALQSGNPQRAQELDLIRGSVFETLINQDSGYSTPPVNLRPMDVFVPAYATPNGEVEAPYVIMAVPRSDDSGTFMEVIVPLDEYQEQPFDWLAQAGNQA